MRTIYIDRATEDLGVDRQHIREEVDVFIGHNGLSHLADLLGA